MDSEEFIKSTTQQNQISNTTLSLDKVKAIGEGITEEMRSVVFNKLIALSPALKHLNKVLGAQIEKRKETNDSISLSFIVSEDITDSEKSRLKLFRIYIQSDKAFSPTPISIRLLNKDLKEIDRSELEISNKNTLEPHKLGEKFGGGVVFFVDKTGQHGLIAAESDQGFSVKWDNGEGYQVGSISETDGYKNTITIVNKLGTRGYYAAKVCRDYNGGGFTDWFLPAFDQLNLLYLKKDIIGGFNGKYYWSSTESNNTGRAWNLLFRPQTPYNTQKIFECNVRAIRAF